MQESFFNIVIKIKIGIFFLSYLTHIYVDTSITADMEVTRPKTFLISPFNALWNEINIRTNM